MHKLELDYIKLVSSYMVLGLSLGNFHFGVLSSLLMYLERDVPSFGVILNEVGKQEWREEEKKHK